MLRESLLTLATRPAVQRWATASPIARRLARRFVAGETAEEALAVAAALNKQGLLATLDQLGEHVATAEEAVEAADEYCRLVDQIAARGLAANVSIKPTHLGLALPVGPALATANLRRVLDRARPYNLFVRIDMEGSAVTQATLDLLWRLRGEGFGEVGPVIQAYLYRSAEDIARLCAEGVRVRLCKGAYREPATIAFPRKADVDANYERLMEYLLRRGRYPGLATHDERLIARARALAGREAIPPDRFEFQMLHGVRRGLQAELAGAGYNVRVYVPYGERWYPYFMRRLAERPANLLFLLRNFWRS
jgi:proline dehydrogenase